MTGSTDGKVDVMAEKEAAQAVRIEDLSSSSGDAGFEAAEMEPRMNTQTILAFIVS